MTAIAAWIWDHLPGGLPAQLTTWRLFPAAAEFCERAANERDRATS
jgi:hypothetical protein